MHDHPGTPIRRPMPTGVHASAVDPPADAAARLRTLVPLAALDAAVLAELASEVEWLAVPAGVRLFTAGDPPDGMYGIVDGRVRFFAPPSGVDGEPAAVTAEAGAGVTFGEGSLLLEGRRSRTAVVVRDALLVRIGPERFRALLSSADVAAAIAGLFAARFASPLDVITGPPAPLSVAVDASIRREDLRWLLDHMRAELGDDPAGPHVAVVEHGEEGARRRLRQADVVIAVRPGDRRPHDLEWLRAWHGGLDELVAAPVELVLLHPASTRMPSGTAAWRQAFPFAEIHHVRRGTADEARRIGRHLAGRSTALVLGGGGARGLAHIGVLRAVAELGIPIDRIGGSSMGAIVGGQAALGRGWAEIAAEWERAWARRRLHLDLSLPTVSLSSGRRARRLFDHLFGDVHIEDFPVDFFCTTTNLSRFELTVRRHGPAARWIRASASAPGLWPPVVDERGELHVDGGQLNNVPSDVMRRSHRGRIIAVDVCATQAPMTVTAGAEPPVGLRHVLRRRSPDRYPSLVETLNRCALLGSLQQRAIAAEHADVYITPDLAAFGFGSFGRVREAAGIGYRAARIALAGLA